MQNIRKKNKNIITNNLKEIKTDRTNRNFRNEDNQLSKLITINQQINLRRSKSKVGLSKQSSISKINIVSDFLSFFKFTNYKFFLLFRII